MIDAACYQGLLLNLYPTACSSWKEEDDGLQLAILGPIRTMRISESDPGSKESCIASQSPSPSRIPWVMTHRFRVSLFNLETSLRSP